MPNLFRLILRGSGVCHTRITDVHFTLSPRSYPERGERYPAFRDRERYPSGKTELLLSLYFELTLLNFKFRANILTLS